MPTEQDPDKDTTINSMADESIEILDKDAISEAEIDFVKATILTMKVHIDSEDD